jgi:transcriptional regulator of acetoin/glycerol metabolism
MAVSGVRGRDPGKTGEAGSGDSPDSVRGSFQRQFALQSLQQEVVLLDPVVELGGHQQAAARALGISRQGLAKMLRRLGIDRTPGNGPL